MAHAGADPSPPRPERKRRLPPTVRGRILLLALAIAVPSILAALAIVWFGYTAERRNLETQLLATASALALALDRQLGEGEGVVWALAASPSLTTQDFAAFDAEARAALRHPGAWIVVSDADGRQYTNTRFPAGTPLLQSHPPARESFALLRPDQAMVSVFWGPLVQDWVVAVEVPVLRDGVPVLAIAVSWMVGIFGEMLGEQTLPATWIGTILDQGDRVVARNRQSDRFVGELATDDLRQHLAQRPKGIHESLSLDGLPTVVAYSRSPTYGWTAVVAVPEAEIVANVREAMGWLFALALGLLFLGVSASAYFARGITGPLTELRLAAVRAGQGTLMSPPDTGLAEVDEVGSALFRSAAQLRDREQRQELLTREVDHRAKNLLAVVQSMLRLTRAQDLRSFVEIFTARLMALARAHSLLSESRWAGADLGRLLKEELAPYGRERTALNGPRVALTPAAAQSLALAVHELTTNAAKHGALSTPAGRVEVSWQVAGGLTMTWSESGGRDLTEAPSRQGFGHRVLIVGITQQLGGKVDLDWRSEGLQVRIWLPPEHIARAESVRLGPAENALPDEPPVQSLAGRAVLVVEDEPVIALMIEGALREAGAEVIGPAADVASARHLIAAHRIDAAVLDRNLKGESSDPLAHLLRDRAIPFAVVTGYAEAALPEEFADVVRLAKPFEPSELIARLGALLRAA